ncbi:MAG TPA: YoaK family protein [Micromonosporaceae bacterium]|jgi:uncharacterized membrane protein YoaK (UPF0700 family)
MDSYVAHPKHGPLPALLLALTVVTGLVDAVSILSLGRVFVANMTGNVVFIAFALAGTPGFSLRASLAALAGFLVGALLGGRMAQLTPHRGRLLRNAAVVEAALLLVALILLFAIAHPGELVRDGVAFLIAVALGVQNAAVRKLRVLDLTTTVLTMTLTGIAADLRTEGAKNAVRRALAVLSMFAGAAVGALLVLHVDSASAIAIALALVACVALAAGLASRTPAPWHDPIPG